MGRQEKILLYWFAPDLFGRYTNLNVKELKYIVSYSIEAVIIFNIDIFIKG